MAKGEVIPERVAVLLLCGEVYKAFCKIRKKDGRGQSAVSLEDECSSHAAVEARTEQGAHPGLNPQEQGKRDGKFCPPTPPGSS